VSEALEDADAVQVSWKVCWSEGAHGSAGAQTAENVEITQ